MLELLNAWPPGNGFSRRRFSEGRVSGDDRADPGSLLRARAAARTGERGRGRRIDR